MEQTSGQGGGAGFPGPPCSAQYPKVLENSEFKSGLPGCYAGVFDKAEK